MIGRVKHVSLGLFFLLFAATMLTAINESGTAMGLLALVAGTMQLLDTR
jgi:hypothetical protein